MFSGDPNPVSGPAHVTLQARAADHCGHRHAQSDLVHLKLGVLHVFAVEEKR